ncbi:hypothetical protein V2J94_01905 [Streptomyces sp. DSM 41524]|uniref:AAA+ ATPase domain-containing protein n=1 Tax=Streptomyces asiaticus subsp. ignotus TaxID=3098222 RepID=A0ABU7PQB8_9ACTN|nr:hypothetical protein [Streptomyces sp. DSM 41524]
MDDMTGPAPEHEPFDGAPSGSTSGEEEPQTASLSADVEDEQADHIRLLRQQGLPKYVMARGVEAGAMGFGSGDAATTMFKTYIGTQTIDPVDGPVRDSDLDRLHELYIAPPSHTALVKHLNRHGVAVLRGAPGSGRYTTALLAARKAMPHGVVKLDSEAGVRRLAKDDGGLQPSRGHVIVGDGRAWANELAQVLIRLRDATYGRSPLVIVVDDQVPVRDLLEHVVEHTVEDDLRFKVLERHLTVQLADQPEDCRKLLEHERLRDDLRGRRAMAEVAGLATQLARRVGDGEDIDQIVQSLGAEMRVKAVKLLGPPPKEVGDGARKPEVSLWSRAFLLACAVLDGTTLSRVSRESHRLAELLHGVRSPSSVPEMPLFEESVQDWLRRSDVEFTDRDGRLVGPRHPECRVRISQPGLGEAIMEVLWHDHSGARGPLLRWLDSLVIRSEEDIRVLAAQTVGLLATFDWAYVHEELLVPWASDKSEHAERRQFAAAWALERAVVDPLLASRVRRLLWRWSQRRDFHACAQTAYGTRIGAMFPAEALNNLERITGSGTKSVWPAVREIYAAGSRPQVLERLADWSASSRHWLRDDAAKCLQRLSRFGGERSITDLLKEPEPRGALLRLTRNVLLSPSRLHRERGWNTMRQWVERADDQPELEGLVADFVAELPESGGKGDGLRERFLFYLRLWGYQRRDDKVAARIGSFVSERWSM